MVVLGKRLVAEGVGTAWLVFIGCGSIVLCTGTVQQGYCALEVASAFGLAFATGRYLFGGTSGAHFNPAVTIGFTVAQRFPIRDVVPYIAAQILGAIAASALLAYIANGRPGFVVGASEFAANGFGDHSPADYQLHSVLVAEFVLSVVLVLANLLIEARRESASIAALVGGVFLMLVYLVSIPITNGSVNPARSTAQALFVGDWALDQLWLFWAAPLMGGVVAGMLFSFLHRKSDLTAVALADSSGDTE
nr:Aquaporin Z 2 [Paraburkholderia busanensis]